MAFYPASQLKLVYLALLTWVEVSVLVYGQSGDSSLLLSTEVVVKTGDPTGIEGIDFNAIDYIRLYQSDTLLLYANTNAPRPNFSVSPEGSGFYNYDMEVNSTPVPIAITEETVPNIELNGPFVFDFVPNGAWSISESGLLVYNASIKRAGGSSALNQPLLYSQELPGGEPQRLINLTGFGHGPDDGSITITSMATGDEIGGHFNPAVFNTGIGITGFDRIAMFNEFGGGVPGGGSGQVSEVKRGVFFRTDEGMWRAVFLYDDQAPGFEEGVTVDGVSFATSRRLSDIIVTTLLSNSVTAFWRLEGFNDSLSLIARDDEPAPGFSGRNWSSVTPLLGFTDEVAFYGTATANSESDIDAIWLEVEDDGETTIDVVFEASEDGSIVYQTTEGSVTFLSLSIPLVGPDKLFYFFATGRDEANEFVSGIWKLTLDANSEPESIDLLAETNTEAPGQLIGGLPMLFQDFQLREVNDLGDLLFSATLFRNSNTRGSLWLSTTEAGILAVAAEGDTLGSGESAVTLDEFYFSEFSGTLAGQSMALSDDGTVAFLGLIPDGDDVGTFRDSALFRSEVNVPKYIWSGKANTDLWWDLSGETSNWDNDAGENWNTPPGAEGTESVEIGALASVKLDTAPANIGSLDNRGALAVTRALTIQNGAEIERLTLDADLIAHGEVNLVGEDNRWLSGAMSGDRGATVEFGGVLTIAPRNSDAIALQTTLSVNGKVVHENELVTLEESGFDQEGSIQIGLLGEYEFASGSITDLSSSASKISNDGVFKKTGSGTGSVNTRYESTIGNLFVEGGTLQLMGEVDLKGTGKQINVSGNALLEIGNSELEFESLEIETGTSAGGAGTLRLAHGVGVEIGNEAEAVFGLTGFDGVGLEIADATVTGEGALLIGNDQFVSARATFLDATFDSLDDGLNNNSVLQIGAEDSEGETALALNKTHFVNNGVVTQFGDVDILPAEPGATAIDNHGTYTLPDSGDIFASQSILDYIFNNASDGRVEKKGLGSSRVEATFINRGALEVGSGTLVLRFGSEFHLNSKLTFGGGNPLVPGVLELGELGLDIPTEIRGSIVTDKLGNPSLSHELRIFSGLNLEEGARFEVGGIDASWSGGVIQGPESSGLKIAEEVDFSILSGSSGPRVLKAPFENRGTVSQNATLTSNEASLEMAKSFTNFGTYQIGNNADIESLELTLEGSSSLLFIEPNSDTSIQNLKIIGGGVFAPTVSISEGGKLKLGGSGDEDRLKLVSGRSFVTGLGALEASQTTIEMSGFSPQLSFPGPDVLFDDLVVDASQATGDGGTLEFLSRSTGGESPAIILKEIDLKNVTLINRASAMIEGTVSFTGGKLLTETDWKENVPPSPDRALTLVDATIQNSEPIEFENRGDVIIQGESVVEESVIYRTDLNNWGRVTVKADATARLKGKFLDNFSVGTESPFVVNGELVGGYWIVDGSLFVTAGGKLFLGAEEDISKLGSRTIVWLKGSGQLNNLPIVQGDFEVEGQLVLSDQARLDVSETLTVSGWIELHSGASIKALGGIKGGSDSIIGGTEGSVDGSVESEGKVAPGEVPDGVAESDGVVVPASLPGGSRRTQSVSTLSETPLIESSGPVLAGSEIAISVSEIRALEDISMGVITINGDYTQMASGVLELEISGSNPEDHDRLIVNGTATLSGALKLVSATGIFPDNGTLLTPFSATSISGQFDSIINDIPSSRQFFDVELTETGVNASAVVLDVATFAEWQAGVFTAEEQADESISSLMADPDEDGLVNLLEYALDGNPRVRTPGLVGIEIGANSEGAPESVAIEFPWANGMTDVEYKVEYSTDLENWTTLDTSLVNEEDLGLVTLTSLSGSVALQSGESLFARLIVSQL